MARGRPYAIPTKHYPPAPVLHRPKRFRERTEAIAGLAILGVLTVLVLIGPFLSPWDPNRAMPQFALQGASAEHWLGTDMYGRDVLTRLLYGGRLSLGAGLVSVLIAAGIGSFLGVIAGYFGGIIDTIISAIADYLLAFPGLLLALTIAWAFGQGIEKAAIGVAIASMPTYIRLARSSVRRLRRALYVRAAQALGAKDSRVILRHVLPNMIAPIVSLAVLDLGWAILHVSALSFLGVGAKPPQAEWGAMLSEARNYIRQTPWLGVMPGAAIALTVLSVNLIGDALQEVLDPLTGVRL